jgi:hypothetical protein
MKKLFQDWSIVMQRDSWRQSDRWQQIFRRGLWVGSVASIAATAMISWRCRRDAHSAISGTNATSHWLWGDRAKYKYRFAPRYTVVGYLIHHASSVFWGTVYERWFPNKSASLLSSAKNAAAVATLACAVDYVVTPKRLTPGFEKHLSMKSMLLVYLAFGAGLGGARYLSTALKPTLKPALKPALKNQDII